MEISARTGASQVTVTALLAGVAARDKESFSRLVSAFDADLRRLAFVICGDTGQADDAVQIAWERLWRKPPTLREPEKLRSWLLTVAANEARHWARRRRRGLLLEQRQASTVEPPDPNLWAEALDLRRALFGLSAKDRELLALRYVLEMNSREIARHLKLSPEGVRSRLARILARLREAMTDE